MDPKSLLLQAIDADRESHVRLLQAFVQAPSPNPPGPTAAAAKVLTEFLASRSIPYETIDPQEGGGYPNIVSDFQGGRGDGPRVVLNGHLDVFPVGDNTDGWDRDPWSGDVAGDRLHGRGVVDMKSGTTSLLLAYAYLHERRDQLKGSVAFCAVSDEETGGRWGTKYLIQNCGTNKKRWSGDVMLSAEPAGCGSIRFSEKGTLRLTATVRTRGAHGAYTNLSKGAVRTAAAFVGDVVAEVEAMPVDLPADMARHVARPDVRRVIDATMGPGTSAIIVRPTVNVGTIRGGLKVNMIPDTCVLELDIRMPVGLTRNKVLDVVHGSIAQCVANEAQTSIEIAVHEAASNPSSFSSLDHPLVGLLADNAKLVAPEADKPLAIPSMGATDCKHYRYAGVPAYVYGCSPNTMAQVNESASISEFVRVTKVHAAATWEYLQ